jgi:hypothetical protein
MRDDDNEDDDYNPGSEINSGDSSDDGSDDSMSEVTPPPKKSRKTKHGSGKARRALKPVRHTPVLLKSNELRRTSLLEGLDAPSASQATMPTMLAAIKKQVRGQHKVLVAT